MPYKISILVKTLCKIYTRPDTVNFDGLDILFLPWICDDSMMIVYMLLTILPQLSFLGHLEVKGFEMHKGF